MMGMHHSLFTSTLLKDIQVCCCFVLFFQVALLWKILHIFIFSYFCPSTFRIIYKMGIAESNINTASYCQILLRKLWACLFPHSLAIRECCQILNFWHSDRWEVISYLISFLSLCMRLSILYVEERFAFYFSIRFLAFIFFYFLFFLSFCHFLVHSWGIWRFPG